LVESMKKHDYQGGDKNMFSLYCVYYAYREAD
jgi:hypothetical protein